MTHQITVRELAEAVRALSELLSWHRSNRTCGSLDLVFRQTGIVDSMVASVLDRQRAESPPHQIHPGPLDVQPVTIDFDYMDH